MIKCTDGCPFQKFEGCCQSCPYIKCCCEACESDPDICGGAIFDEKDEFPLCNNYERGE
ncbi:MAG: hypothetical protein PHX62_05745 [Bacilli bacterium]|nr:hypothetical protein [Bacilli bacterium]